MKRKSDAPLRVLGVLAGAVLALPLMAARTTNALSGVSFDVPKAVPCPELTSGSLKGLWIDGEPLKGKPTRFFAYVILPEGASATNKAPGMVLAHGGLGTAYASWARTWAARGYAAIVPDNCGSIPVRAPGGGWIPSGVGGPAGWGRRDLADEPPCDQWPYHAVAAVVRSHSYLRSLPEVDAENIGLTGISWGGFLTMLTAATDTRFKFAAPVYACAFYEEFAEYTDFYSRTYKSDAESARRLTKWAALFDPMHYVPTIKMPLHWFASSNDRAFPFDLLQRTVALAPGRAALSIRKDMVHTHGPLGENMPELFLLADHVLRKGAPLPVVSRPLVANGEFRVTFDAAGWKLSRVDLIWCGSDHPVYGTKWSQRAYPVPEGCTFTAPVPPGARRVFANFVSAETFQGCYPEALVSSPCATVK